MKISKKELVILTWTIKPSWKLKDYWWGIQPDLRWHSYFNTICFYILRSKFYYIVFCENSCYDISDYKETLFKLAKFYGKKLEILQYNWDHLKSEHLWYWYWEWECLDYAFKNSKLLEEVESFRKITWRYVYANIDNIVEYSSKNDNMFFKNFSQVVWISTWLFKVKKDIYEKYLYDIKSCMNLDVKFERLYYNKLIKEDIKFWKLNSIPIRVWATIEDVNEVNRRRIPRVWKILFHVWQWSFSKCSLFLDKCIIFAINIKQRIKCMSYKINNIH